ncbi:hypothetical protein QP547_01040 [Weeksella virosa]|uniref:hypothetical protein n=1 Tax=Weeksella virosa TaxID=1014 RepID=UPI0025572A79|nr:hypothetical protein [Weeksella virosa]MDK7674395.1 hypothetical protein [Weeksella virosa]
MEWDIRFFAEEKEFQLGILAECEIVKSVENLVDTATVILPEAYMNQVFDLQQKIKRGSEVHIYLGYNGNLVKEFTGYVRQINTNDSSLRFECEDALFLFRKGVNDVQLTKTKVSAIAQYLINQLGVEYQLSCDYDIAFDKFVIHQATAYDVLKKLQEETGANIYFDTENKTLHIHPPFTEKGGDVIYDLHRNVEKSSLEYKTAEDRKVEVTVESVAANGTVQSYTTGTTGGEKVTKKVSSIGADGLRIIAENEYRNRMQDAYEGDLTAWLIPYCEPTYTAEIRDSDYPYKNGFYYVKQVKTNFSQNGGVRTINLGIKLS